MEALKDSHPCHRSPIRTSFLGARLRPGCQCSNCSVVVLFIFVLVLRTATMQAVSVRVPVLPSTRMQPSSVFLLVFVSAGGTVLKVLASSTFSVQPLEGLVRSAVRPCSRKSLTDRCLSSWSTSSGTGTTTNFPAAVSCQSGSS